MRLPAGLLVLAVLVAPASAQPLVELEEAFPNLPTFTRPVDIQTVPDGSDRIAVVEKNGRIRLVDNTPDANETMVLLDIRDRVTQPTWEEGLLGLAFHPDYAENGRLYVHYTAHPAHPGGQHRTVIARYTRDAEGPEVVDPATEEVLIELEQPGLWHNGGQVAFGPNEGPGGRRYLYLSLGDGAGPWDPFGHGQDRTTLFGTLLRIDVDQTGGDDVPYAIPPDNPFVGNDDGWREEIWAFGLRNPWRFSFDVATNRLWLGDVGQNAIEEVNLIISGGNYGWPIKEGTHCGLPPEPGQPSCDDPILIDPVWEYLHPPAGGAAVTGGYVYRGDAIPDLVGRYVYADFMFGHLWALDYEPGLEPENDLLLETGLFITTFGVDSAGELLLATYLGRIYRVVASDLAIGPAPEASISQLRLAGPNPATHRTAFIVQATAGEHVRVVLFDVTGREVKQVFDGAAGSAPLTLEVDVSALAAGTYLARLFTSSATGAAVTLTVIR